MNQDQIKTSQVVTLLLVLSFTADSEREKRDWMEALQEAIAETLSDYEVAEKIWSNRSNRMCADCKAPNPDWASINLCVVICKNCAGTCLTSLTLMSCSGAFGLGPGPDSPGSTTLSFIKVTSQS